MIRATKAGHFHAPVAETVVLTHAERSRSKAQLRAVSGLDIQLDLSESPSLMRGDSYVLEDGRLIEILAAPEPLLEVRGSDALDMSRIAFHLGKQQLDCEISGKHIRLHRNANVLELLRSLGAKVIEIEAPFHPEGKPGQQACNHDSHSHDHGHSHDHSHDDGHKHGEGCNHDHDHGHKHAH